MDQTPIAAAVAPLKADAVAWAEKAANDTVERVRTELEAVGWDLNVAAPYPKSTLGRNYYKVALAKRERFERLTRSLAAVRRPDEPRLVAMADDLIARFVEMSKEATAAQYDAFVAKLEAKVGAHSAADALRQSRLVVVVPDRENSDRHAGLEDAPDNEPLGSRPRVPAVAVP